MNKLTIYLKNDLHIKFSAGAKSQKLSSIIKILKKELDKEWPKEINNTLASWLNFPSQEEIRASIGKDLAREDFS